MISVFLLTTFFHDAYFILKLRQLLKIILYTYNLILSKSLPDNLLIYALKIIKMKVIFIFKSHRHGGIIILYSKKIQQGSFIDGFKIFDHFYLPVTTTMSGFTPPTYYLPKHVFVSNSLLLMFMSFFIDSMYNRGYLKIN